jgi:hypothetical protein
MTPVKLLPRSRRAQLALAGGVLAALLALGWCYEYRPWEAHYRGRPASWWEKRVREQIKTVITANNVWFDVISPSSLGVGWRDWLKGAGVPVCAILPAPPAAEELSRAPGAFSVLAQLHRSRHTEVRRYAAACLSNYAGSYRPTMEPADVEQARQALGAALDDPDRVTRTLARSGLSQIDPAALTTYDRQHPGAERDGGD